MKVSVSQNDIIAGLALLLVDRGLQGVTKDNIEVTFGTTRKGGFTVTAEVELGVKRSTGTGVSGEAGCSNVAAHTSEVLDLGQPQTAAEVLDAPSRGETLTVAESTDPVDPAPVAEAEAPAAEEAPVEAEAPKAEGGSLFG